MELPFDENLVSMSIFFFFFFFLAALGFGASPELWPVEATLP